MQKAFNSITNETEKRDIGSEVFCYIFIQNKYKECNLLK